MLGDVARERSPSCGDVDLAILDCLDQSGRRIGFAVVAIDHVAANIVDYSLLAERMRRRGVVAIIADKMHANGEAAQLRVADGDKMKMARGLTDEDIGGAIIGAGGLHQII